MNRTIDEEIIALYKVLTEPGGWVGLSRLRNHLGGRWSREEVDTALARLFRAHKISLIAEVNQKTLTEQDWRDALHIVGDKKHLYRVENGRI